MAKYLISTSSHFTPFTYDELVRPIAEQTAVHNATQDYYDALSMDTNALANYISDNPEDSEAKAMYDSYRNKLATLQDNLWKNGITAQTRRDLAEARAGYSKDITRLAKAIESRQARSKEYWDYAHKNPDAIMGYDPGVAGLNSYLADENFGSNWYTYDGQQFMAEVGADAKARAAEMISNPAYANDIHGYITRIYKQGFTNAEVDAAVKAVQNGTASNLTGAEKILADTLQEHINSTGASVGKNITQSQYNRFFGYGRTGLAQGIGGIEMKDFSDKVWDMNADFENWKRKQKYSAALAAAQDSPQGEDPEVMRRNWLHSGPMVELRNEIEGKTTAELYDRYHAAFTDKDGNPKSVFLNVEAGKAPVELHNSTEADKYINSDSRQLILDELGLDVAWNKEQTSPDGHYKVSKSGDVQYSADGKTWYSSSQSQEAAQATAAFKMARDNHKAHLDNLRSLNDGLDLNSLTVTPKDAQKMIKKHPYLSEVPYADWETAVKRQEVKALSGYAPALFGSGEEYDDVREAVARELSTRIGMGAESAFGGRNSNFAFYAVGPNGYEVSKDGTTDYGDIFDLYESGEHKGEIKRSSIAGAYVLPEDLKPYGASRVRLIVRNFKNDKKSGKDIATYKTWVTSAENLGRIFDSALNNDSFVKSVSYMYDPLSNPVDYLSGKSSGSEWAYNVSDMFFRDRMLFNDNGVARLARANDILRNDNLYNSYLNNVYEYMNDAFARTLDVYNRGRRHIISVKDAKAKDSFTPAE